MRLFIKSFLSFKLSLMMTSIIIFSLVLLNFLTFFKCTTTVNNVINSRFLVIGGDLLNTITNSLNLGLSLKEVQTTQSVIEAIKKNDRQVLSISVFDLKNTNEGQILYTTRHAGIGGNVPVHWLEKMRHQETEKFWTFTDENVVSVGITIFNSFKQPAGGIVIRYDQEEPRQKLFVFLNKMVNYSILVAGICFLFIATAVYWTFKDVTESFSKMKDVLIKLTGGHVVSFAPSSLLIEAEFNAMLLRTNMILHSLNELDRLLVHESSDAKRSA